MGQADFKADSKTKITAAQISAQLAKLHQDQQTPWAYYSEVKSGPSWGQGGRKLYILDAVAIRKSWSNPLIVGFEIKTSRADFLKDKKWHNYRAYCHKLSFVCPTGIITLDDLRGYEDTGLIYYSPEHNTLFTKRRAMRREIDMRSAEVTSMLYYLCLYRCG